MKLRSRQEKKARITATVTSGKEEEGWAALLPELFNRIVDGHLPPYELCTAVPMVCKAWNKLHKERMASQTGWRVIQPVTPAGLQGFRMVAPGVEALALSHPDYSDAKKKGLLTRMLAIPAPNLRYLALGCGKQDTSVLCSISRLTQLTKLILETSWAPQTPRRVGDLDSLTALRNLQKFHCSGVSMWVPEEWSAALWTSLAALPHLRKVEVGVRNDIARWMHEDTIPDDDLGPFLRQLSRLTRIKSLKLSNENFQTSDWTNTRSTLYASISALTQLTALKLNLRLGPAKSHPCLKLPQLKKLQLFFTQHCHPAKEHGCMSTDSLTRLALHSDTDQEYPADERTVEEVLPPTTPALATLRSLELWGSMLDQLTPALASALPQLTSLAWRHSEMTAFSPALTAVSLITSLVELDLADNARWELGGEDPAPLLALPNLTKLELGDPDYTNTGEDVRSFVEQLPGLTVTFDGGCEK